MKRLPNSSSIGHTGAWHDAGERPWTVMMLARWYGVKPAVIMAFINAGTLKAQNVAAPGSKRPRWRILPDDHVAFEVAHGHEVSGLLVE